MATWDLDVYESKGIWHIVGEVHKNNMLWDKSIIFSSRDKEIVMALFDGLYQYMMSLERVMVV